MRPSVNTITPALLTTVTVPLLKEQSVAEQVKFGMLRVMVSVLPTTWTRKSFPKLVIVPCSKVPVSNSTLFANAAVGKAKAKSVNSITRARLIHLPPTGRFLPPQLNVPNGEILSHTSGGPQPLSPQNTGTFTADELPK